MRNQAVAALGLAGDLFVHQGQLCHATTGEDGMPIAEPNIAAELARVAQFTRLVSRHGDPVTEAVAVPDWLTRMVATLGDWPGVPVLRGITTMPFPRPDGTIVATAGFDPMTGILLRPTFPCRPVPSWPTQRDAQAAATRLLDWLADFPWREEADKIAALAGFLTPVARPMIAGRVPGFAVSSNRPRVGKSKLVDFLTMPALGRSCLTALWPSNDARAAEVLTTLAHTQISCCHFSHLRDGSSFGGGPVDLALTTRSAQNGLAATSPSMSKELRTVLFVTGTRITPGVAANQRLVTIELQTDEEHPERRTRSQFRRPDLIAAALAGRGDLVHDLLVILRAHALAGRPQSDLDGAGSFEEWDRIVRGALHFATGQDCLANRWRTVETGPERLLDVALLRAIHELPRTRQKNQGLRSLDIIAAARDGKPELPCQALREVLKRLGQPGQPIDAIRLGHRLATMKNQTYGGMTLRPRATRLHGAVVWYVE